MDQHARFPAWAAALREEEFGGGLRAAAPADVLIWRQINGKVGERRIFTY